MKRVLIVIPSLEGGGAARVALSHARMLQDAGHEVQVVNFFENAVFDVSDVSRTVLFSRAAPGSLVEKIFYAGLAARKLSLLIGEGVQTRQIILMSHMEYANIICGYIRWFLSARVLSSINVVCVVHNNPDKFVKRGRLKSLLISILYKNALNGVRAVVAVSVGAAKALESGFDLSQVKVLYNSFDIGHIRASCSSVDQLSPAPHAGSLAPSSQRHNKIRAIAAGRFVEQKGFEVIVPALLKVGAGQVCLTFLGSGSGKDGLLGQVENARITADVRFLDFCKDPYKELVQHEVLLMPSLWEGFGNMVVEALACGCWVISTDCNYGPREIIGVPSDFVEKLPGVEIYKCGALITQAPDHDRSSEEAGIATALKYYKANRELVDSWKSRRLSRSEDFDVRAGRERLVSLLAEL